MVATMMSFAHLWRPRGQVAGPVIGHLGDAHEKPFEPVQHGGRRRDTKKAKHRRRGKAGLYPAGCNRYAIKVHQRQTTGARARRGLRALRKAA